MASIRICLALLSASSLASFSDCLISLEISSFNFSFKASIIYFLASSRVKLATLSSLASCSSFTFSISASFSSISVCLALSCFSLSSNAPDLYSKPSSFCASLFSRSNDSVLSLFISSSASLFIFRASSLALKIISLASVCTSSMASLEITGVVTVGAAVGAAGVVGV